ncbi:MAG: GntR family transcriptional regulator [candidate division WOR-3 bacterium]|jgi:GntR family transcriptional regulator
MKIDKSKPIWRQIVREIKERISRGDIKDNLPTVRALAEELGVNPNTVARAYREMEREGVIESWVGKGTWVKEGSRKDLKGKMIEEEIGKFVESLTSMGLSKKEIKKLVRKIDDKN